MNFNRVIVGGNLTRDPELRYTPQGAPVCNFAMAVNRYWNDRKTGQRQEETSFLDFEAWGKTAELVAQHCKKGRPLLVEGRLKQDRWQDQGGQNRSKVKVVAEQIQFVGGKRDQDGSAAAPAQDPFGPPSEDAPF